MPDFSFGNFKSVEVNGLADFYAAGEASNKVIEGRLKNQGSQQDLTDRGTLRDQASGLAAGNPLAIATAATLPKAGGDLALAGLATMNKDQREAFGQTLGVTSAVSGAILAAPPEHHAALWAQMRPLLLKSGATQTPEVYPGDEFLKTHQVSALDAQKQIEMLNQKMVPLGSDYSPMSLGRGPQAGPGGVMVNPGAAGGAAGQPGGFTDQMKQSESSGRTGVVNAGGYAGNFQFGAPRLQDLGMYAPAPGEIDAKGKWNGQMAGSFSIPGYPDVKTKADFLANPDAQRAAMGANVADIDKAIAATPGADKLDPNGLRGVAHLGGVASMRRFVSSGGLYDPQDANGTHLSDYYQKFSGPGGAAALASAHGHPDGPLPPAPAAGVQYASRGPVPGESRSMTDASGGGAVAGPTGEGVDAVIGRLRGEQGGGAGPAIDVSGGGAPAPVVPTAATPTVANPNPLLSVAQPAAPVAAPQNGLAGPAPGASGAGKPVIITQAGKMIPAGTPGWFVARMPDGSIGEAQLQGAPPKIKSTPVGGWMINTDENTGREVSRFQIPDASRAVFGPSPDGRGTQMYQSGHPVGEVIPFNNHDVVIKMAEAANGQIPALSQQALEQEQTLQKTLEARQAAAGLPTGANFESRAAMANWIKTYAPGVAKLMGVGKDGRLFPDPGKAAEAAKLLTGAAQQNEKAMGGSGGLGITQIFINNNANLGMQPEAIRDMSNLAAVTSMATKDYLQGKIGHISDQNRALITPGNKANYEPVSEYDKAWFTKNNTLTYFAAVQAMNGKPYAEWSKGLNDADMARALGVIARIDPTSTVTGRNGHPLPVNRFVPADASNPSGVVVR